MPKKNLEELDFSRLADHLVTPKRTPDQLGSFYYLGFKADYAPDQQGQNETLLTNVSEMSNHLEKCKKWTRVCVNQEISPMERMTDKSFKLCRGSSKKELKEKKLKVHVFIPTKKCDLVYELKTLRNDKIGHPRHMGVTDAELEGIFCTAKQAYQHLEAFTDDIERELEEIEQGKCRVCNN